MAQISSERRLFGTDGIRGVANQYPMTAEMALALGRSVAEHFRQRDKRCRVVIGKDTRLSGYMFESALEAGIVSAGADVMIEGTDEAVIRAHAEEIAECMRKALRRFVTACSPRLRKGDLMVRLLINVDHVATLRQQRDTIYPDPVLAAGICELAGADGITIHLREDRRHAQERDVRILRQTVRGSLNLEMAVVPSIIDIAVEVKPDMCTLVPGEARGTHHRGRSRRARPRGRDRQGGAATARRRHRGQPVHRSGGRRRRGCAPTWAPSRPSCTPATTATPSWARPEPSRELARLEKAGRIVVDTGLRLAAGHGLDYANVGPVAGLADLEEMSIGHAIVSRAVLVGMERAVLDMRAAIDRGVREAHRE